MVSKESHEELPGRPSTHKKYSLKKFNRFSTASIFTCRVVLLCCAHSNDVARGCVSCERDVTAAAQSLSSAVSTRYGEGLAHIYLWCDCPR